MTESGKDHSNFTRIIIAFFQKTVKHQSLRNHYERLLFVIELNDKYDQFKAFSRKRKTPDILNNYPSYPVIRRATWTPLAEAWEREWVMPLPSPMM